MKTLIIVPAFNEERSIAAVLNDLKSAGLRNIVVIDDGSTDKTAALAKKSGVVVLSHIINRGLGAALGTGFAFANQNDFDFAVTFDADGQHQAADVKKTLSLLRKRKSDVVVGSRLQKHSKAIPFDRLILNHLSNVATFCLYGVWATDTLSGLRAFNKKALKSIKIKTQRMEVSNEFFKEIKRNNLRYQEIPIEPIYTKYSLERSYQGRFPVVRLAATMIFRLFR